MFIIREQGFAIAILVVYVKSIYPFRGLLTATCKKLQRGDSCGRAQGAVVGLRPKAGVWEPCQEGAFPPLRACLGGALNAAPCIAAEA